MKQQKGFTIIELLVVIVILGILATISFSTYRSVQKEARDAESKSAIDTINDSLKLSKFDGSVSDYSFANKAALGLFLETNFGYILPTSGANTHHYFYSDDGQEVLIVSCLSDDEFFALGTTQARGNLGCSAGSLSGVLPGFQTFSF